MYCAKCGTECASEYRFCKSCGAPVGAASEQPEVVASAAGPAIEAAATTVAAVAIASSVPPPAGMPPVVYKVPQSEAAPAAQPVAFQVAQPGAGQSVYYVNPQTMGHAHTAQQLNLLQSLRGRIQSLASTESLEGFSLRQMFGDVFKKRGAAAVEDYILCGTSKTTPPIELVETGWPKPWLFFRLLAALVIAYVAMTFIFMRTDNPNMVPGMMFLGAFAVPLATLTLFF